MLTKMEKSAFVIVALIVVMLACGPHPVSAGQNGAGMWVYKANWSIALVNLTDYPLTYLRDYEPSAYPYPIDHECHNCIGCSYPMLEAGTDWQVEPYRTKVWGMYKGSCPIVNPLYYDGRMTLYSTGFQKWAFDLVFKAQGANDASGHGTWIGLSPHWTYQEWSTAYNNFANGRWVTPVDDYEMHNVMTLISSYVMVTLYCADLNRLVVVVQQLYGRDPNGNELWDDSKVYKGLPLDFVDNGGGSVPGQ
jgi:hypothetical protein